MSELSAKEHNDRVRRLWQGGILGDSEIKRAIACGDIEIDPFEPAHVNPASVDLTLGDEVVTYVGASGVVILDAKAEPLTVKRRMPAAGFDLFPFVGYLMHTRERIFTRKYVPVLDGKSSVGRLFMSVHETAGFGDPGFDGQYTLEVTVVHPLRVYPGMQIAQMRFHTIVGEVEKPYAGNYTGEAAKGPVASRCYRQFLSKDAP